MAKSLLEKLGYKPGTDAAVVSCPPELAEALPLQHVTELDGPRDLTLVFVPDLAGTDRAFEAARHYREGDRLWFAYPKLSGARASDISRDRGWEGLSMLGFLGVTQIALDADWSALRFRRRGEIAKLTRRSEVTEG